MICFVNMVATVAGLAAGVTSKILWLFIHKNSVGR